MHYFWDFDGTLFDSYPHIAAAMHLTLDKYGISFQPGEPEALLRFSLGACREYYHITDKQYAFFRRSEQNPFLTPPVIPYPQTAETLWRLKENGHQHFLYTHRDEAAITYLKKQKLDVLFSGFITGTAPFPPKPAPDALVWALDHWKLKKEDCTMVGDREIDVLAGVDAGFHTVLFDEFHTERETQAEKRIYSFSEI